MKLYVGTIFCALLLVLKIERIIGLKNEDESFWKKLSHSELQKNLKHISNTKKAKNVILFIGDGMSLPTLAAGRIFKNQRRAESQGISEKVGAETLLTFETFPNVGLSRTYNTDFQVPDSASTASALATGVKTNYGTIGFDNSVKRGKGESQMEAHQVESIVKWAQDAGMDTGLVTNTRLTDGTPAGFYAHAADRGWECDAAIANEERGDFFDIAKQAVYSDPGRRIKVLLGGGEMAWKNGVVKSTRNGPDRPEDDFACSRLDNEDLIETFLKKHEHVPGFEDTKGRYIQNYAGLKKAIDERDTYDYLLGLFGPSSLKFDAENDKNVEDREPDLVEMTELAIKFLSKNNTSGFFLMVEGGMLDIAHHFAEANNALHETMMLDNAVEKALELVDTEETLIIVTADHGHTMSYSGYTKRGGDIRGFSTKLDVDGKAYNLLSYANGRGFKKHYGVENGKIVRKEVTSEETKEPHYVYPSTVETEWEYHSGADVGIFAIGPWSHLFRSVHEQTYINTVMTFSACLGEYKDEPHCNGSCIQTISLIVIIGSFVLRKILG